MQGWTWKKVQKQGGDENTRRLPYNEKMVEKKDKKTTLHQLLDTVICNRHRVVFLSSFPTIFRYIVG